MKDKIPVAGQLPGLGQSQNERFAKELAASFVAVDERKTEDLLRFVRKLADHVRFFPAHGNEPTETDRWGAWFPFQENNVSSWLDGINTGETRPDMGLLATFCELYHYPQTKLNELTHRHLEFYFRDVLRFTPRSAVPDRAHVVFQLKKGVSSTIISPDLRLSAGKDSTGVERIYKPKHEMVVHQATVDSLRSLYVDTAGTGNVYQALVANSADGLGAELPAVDAKWRPFGHAALPLATVGFAIASPLLRMQEATRTVTVTLELSDVDKTLTATKLNNSLEVLFTTPDSWIEVPCKIGLDKSKLTVTATVGEDDPAITDYNSKVHGGWFLTTNPLLVVRLRQQSSDGVPYTKLQPIGLNNVTLTVEVEGAQSLQVENEQGVFDPKKSFPPFGMVPTVGSRFFVRCPEAESKPLTTISLTLGWQGLPSSFSTHYANYTNPPKGSSDFKVDVQYRGVTSWGQKDHALFVALTLPGTGTSTNSTNTKKSSPKLYEESSNKAFIDVNANQTMKKEITYYGGAQAKLKPVEDGFTLTLKKDFFHNDYRKKSIENIVDAVNRKSAPVLLNEPYTPIISEMRLDYTAKTQTVVLSTTDSMDDSVQFFHVLGDGARREHAALRHSLPFVLSKQVSLLPQYEHEGELWIGIVGIRPGDSITLLFQIAEGSADPNSIPKPPQWSVLCHNYWRPLSSDQVVRDTTHGLLTSGVVLFVIPKEATLDNTLLPSGKIWIRCGVGENVLGVSQMIAIMPNAAEVQFADNGNDPAHYSTALGPENITKIKNGNAAIQSIKQPYSSFGGTPTEQDAALYTRASERLRHKNRCITPWDYERIVLELFPRVHRVKCIPHAHETSWSAPGHVLLVVVPDLRNKNAVDPLEPRVDVNTLTNIREAVQARAGMQVTIKVKNPRYQKIRLDFRVRFYPEFAFNTYRAILHKALIEVLCPWAFGESRDLTFGGTVHKSALLDFVEELPYVDYLTDFFMTTSVGDKISAVDVHEVTAETPDTILVSAATHDIREVD
ncbi:MAG: baseplate J/gp47 family protein [Myxococcales bacterium]|nr:baseplate J/gp47 family protein [Myxococcales bacterium]